MKLHEKLALSIKQSGLKVSEVGRRAGIPRSTMQRWVNGTGTGPRADQMAAIAGAIGVQIEDLMGEAPMVPGNATLEPRELEMLERARRLGVERTSYLLETIEGLGYEEARARLLLLRGS